jgi:hypothetical protein
MIYARVVLIIFSKRDINAKVKNIMKIYFLETPF